MRAGEDKYDANSRFTVAATFTLVANSDLHLTHIDAHYYVYGCVCLGAGRKLILDGEQLNSDFSYDLRSPVTLTAGSAHTVTVSLTLRPYWSIRAAADCDYGEIELTFNVVELPSTTPKTVVGRFRFQADGTLSEIDTISSPPILSDDQIRSALDSGVISSDEYRYLADIQQTARYRAFNATSADDSGLINDLDIDRIKTLGRRILDSPHGNGNPPE
ncbi:MAG TPA: hypothetical protein VHD36_09725 [Pirellulales bacterium]|nr:hypothetical protein [Pirellulales bacterium]